MFSPASFFLFPTAKSVYSKLMQSPYGQRLSPLFQFLLYFREKNHTDASEVPVLHSSVAAMERLFQRDLCEAGTRSCLAATLSMKTVISYNKLRRSGEMAFLDAWSVLWQGAVPASPSQTASLAGGTGAGTHSLTQGKLNRQSWDQAAISEQRHEPPLHKRVF